MCFIGICILSFYLFCHSLFSRVYLSSMLFCACSSVTYSYRHYKRLYACSLLVYVYLYGMCCRPVLSCAGDRAVTVRKLSLCLCLYGLYIRLIYVETENFNL